MNCYIIKHLNLSQELLLTLESLLFTILPIELKFFQNVPLPLCLRYFPTMTVNNEFKSIEKLLLVEIMTF